MSETPPSVTYDTGQPDISGRSFGELVGQLSQDFSRLMRKEIELAKTETKEELTKAGQTAGMFGGAGVAGLLTLIFLSVALVYALSNVMEPEWSALIVGLLWAVIAAVLVPSAVHVPSN